MADTVDLSGDLAVAVNNAATSGHPVVISYVGDDGCPATSFRGSAQVHGPSSWPRVDPSATDTVYQNMIEAEQRLDPDANGVAVVIDIEVLHGSGANGFFEQRRAD